MAKARTWAEATLGGTDPLVFSALGGAVAALMFLTLYVVQRGRVRDLEEERDRITAVAVRAREILATAPDGLFLWDHILGGITCSRRLAVLLNLEGGTQSRYDDIRAKFDGENLKALERSVSSLRGNGAPFGILLTTDQRTLEAVGARAETEDGRPVADIVWMRDVSELIGGDGPPAAQPDPGVNTSGLDDRHLTALLDAMPIPIWLRDSGLRLAFVNRAAQGVVEADPGLATKAREAGDGANERRLLDIDGTARLMDISEIPLGPRGGGDPERPGGTVGYAVDRTEREEAEGELKRQSRARDAVLDTLGTAVAIFTADKRLDFANPAYAALWGLDAAWLGEKPDFGEILEKQRELRQLPEVADFRTFKAEQTAQFNAVTVPGTAPVTDLMHLPDGRTLRRTVAPHGDGGLVFAFDDVSEQLGLERSVKELGAVQRETLDNLHEGVAVYGSDGRLKLCNPVYARLWKLDEALLNGEPHITDVVEKTRALVPPPDGAENWSDADWPKQRDLIVARLLSRAATSGQIKLANGTVVDYANVPLPDGAVLLSYLDVTDSARVESALRQRAEAFQEADRMKSEFIANVSYEVRTPLNTVIGFADMLAQNMFGELNPRQSDYAKGILNTSRSLVNILGDILDLASIEAGRLELKKDTFDVHAFLVACLNLVQERARSGDLKVEFDCPPDIGWMIADERRMKQVIFNLLSNAITFTAHHGTVRLEARRQGDDMIFTVADTGIGIPHDDRERIMRPFEKGSARNGAGGSAADADTGTGLGLNIVSNFVELHGGALEVKSMPGRGTTVTCKIPAGRVGGPVTASDEPPVLDAIRAALDDGQPADD
ncbi:MAG: ATP-binding protein [Magnetovibrio sp.]|nr:ATP-binding protein [Magnetovibrio sp.]